MKARILVNYTDIGQHAFSLRDVKGVVLTRRVIVEHEDTSDSLQTFLRFWQERTFIVHEGRNLLYNNIIAIETKDEQSTVTEECTVAYDATHITGNIRLNKEIAAEIDQIHAESVRFRELVQQKQERRDQKTKKENEG